MARPTKDTPETRKKLEDAFRMGMPITLACDYAGIGASTFHEWCAKNPEFAEKATSLRAESAVRNMGLMNQAAKKDWRAAAETLRLTYPHIFGKNVMEQHIVSDQPIEIIVRRPDALNEETS